MVSPAPATPTPPHPGPAPALPRLFLHTITGIGLFLLLIVVLSLCLRSELEGLGRVFVGRFGLPGLFIGTWLADALSVPVPPQVYLLTAHLSGLPPLPVLASVSTASVIAGHCGYHLARRLGTARLLAGPMGQARARALPLFSRYGVWAAALGGVLPIPFSWLCYASGLYQVPYGLFSLFTLLRVPRILFYYVLIQEGWG